PYTHESSPPVSTSACISFTMTDFFIIFYLLFFFFLLISRPLISTLFPYTTLFRSLCIFDCPKCLDGIPFNLDVTKCIEITRRNRSEEHTSELQSRFDLVCRLLLEKKNISIETM